MLAPWKKSYDQPGQHIKKQRHYFANKDPSSKSYGFSSSHVWMWELDHKDGWVLKNGCFWTVVLEKTLESPLDCNKIKPVNHKGNSDTLATWCEKLIHSKRPWCWERLKVGGEGDDRGWDGWMASLTRWTWGLSKLWELVMQLMCCSPWGHKESDMTDWTTMATSVKKKS